MTSQQTLTKNWSVWTDLLPIDLCPMHLLVASSQLFGVDMALVMLLMPLI